MPPSLKQGVITHIPKKDKSPLFLKNWRPISILNTDYKILTGCLATRIKKVLPSIISHDQCGFLHGRYIGECIRKVLDIISYCEDNSQSGLLFFADFEKAFDSVERKFLFRALVSFNFGPDIINWIHLIYNNIKSTVINNGFWTKYFDVSRGVRQGCALSPYLFIICSEILAIAVRSNQSLRGINICNQEFRICQYADDTVFFIDMCNKSFSNFIKVLNEFSSNSSLKINYDKCFVKRVGPGRLLNTVFCEDLPVVWTNDTIGYLGIQIPNEIDDIININFANKPNVIRDCLKPWEARKLSLMGKVTILKCLAMPKLTYCFSILPNPSEDFFHCMQNILFEFLWEGKPDRIKRNVLMNSYSEGGLQVPHVKTVCNSLKASWVKRFLVDQDKWFFLQRLLSDKGGFYFFDCNIHYRDKVLANIHDDFYRNVFEAWFLYKFRKPGCKSEYLAENIWFNSFITIDHSVVFMKSWFDKGVKTISDLCNNDDTFKGFETFCETFDIITDFVTYFGIIHSIPVEWKSAIQQMSDNTSPLSNMKHAFETSKQPVKLFYKNVISSVTISLTNNKLIQKWKTDCSLDDPLTTLQKAFNTSFRCTLDPLLRNFNFRFLHRISPTNSYLFKANLNNSPVCNFCNEDEQTIIHMYSTCRVTSTFWKEVLSWLKQNNVINRDPSISEMLLLFDDNRNFLLLNTVFVLCKYFIFSSKYQGNALHFQAFQNKMRSLYEMECQVSLLRNKSAVNRKKWSPLFDVIPEPVT